MGKERRVGEALQLLPFFALSTSLYLAGFYCYPWLSVTSVLIRFETGYSLILTSHKTHKQPFPFLLPFSPSPLHASIFHHHHTSEIDIHKRRVPTRPSTKQLPPISYLSQPRSGCNLPHRGCQFPHHTVAPALVDETLISLVSLSFGKFSTQHLNQPLASLHLPTKPPSSIRLDHLTWSLASFFWPFGLFPLFALSHITLSTVVFSGYFPTPNGKATETRLVPTSTRSGKFVNATHPSTRFSRRLWWVSQRLDLCSCHDTRQNSPSKLPLRIGKTAVVVRPSAGIN